MATIRAWSRIVCARPLPGCSRFKPFHPRSARTLAANRNRRCATRWNTRRIEEKAAEVAAPELLQQLHEDLKLRLHRRHVVLDLVLGRSTRSIELWGWLQKNGLSQFDLRWFLQNPVTIDVLGLDYYSHSETELYPSSDKKFRQRIPTKLSGLYKTVRDYWERYQIPLMLTETSFYGEEGERLQWLEQTIGRRAPAAF